MARQASPSGDRRGATQGPQDFDAFWAREYQQVLGLALVLSGRYEIAQEITQEAFLAAYRRWPVVSHMDKPGAWVRHVVSNQATSVFRKAMTERRANALQASAAPIFTEETYEIWELVRRLPRRQAQAVALHYLSDLPLAEVAEAMNCSVETVRTHLKGARSTLKGVLEDEH